MPNTYIYTTISYAFLQEEPPHPRFLFSRCFQSYYVQQSQHSHQLLAWKQGEEIILIWNAGFFTLKNLAVDTGHLAGKVLFDAESEYDIHISYC